MNIHTFIARENRSNSRVLTPENMEKMPISGVEKRVFVGEIELRASKKGSGPGEIVGYAAKYNKISQDLGGWVEKLAPGCFDDCMEDDVCCLRNHGDDNLLGRTTAGTCILSLDDVGLKYTCDLPDTQCGRDTAVLVARRDMRGSSFQFSIAMDGQEWDWDGPKPLRTVKRVGRLYDVSPVTNPAYLDTDVDMRSFRAALEAHKELQAEIVRRSLSLAKARLRLAAASF
jgi:HK97 family phage prohead protease